MKFEDIEVGKLYATHEPEYGISCCKVVDKDPAGTWVKTIAVDPEDVEAENASRMWWRNSAHILATWVDYTAQQAEKNREARMFEEAREASANSIRVSLGALGISTFFDIDTESGCPEVKIIVANEDAAAFAAELVRAARREDR